MWEAKTVGGAERARAARRASTQENPCRADGAERRNANAPTQANGPVGVPGAVCDGPPKLRPPESVLAMPHTPLASGRRTMRAAKVFNASARRMSPGKTGTTQSEPAAATPASSAASAPDPSGAAILRIFPASRPSALQSRRPPHGEELPQDETRTSSKLPYDWRAADSRVASSRSARPVSAITTENEGCSVSAPSIDILPPSQDILSSGLRKGRSESASAGCFRHRNASMRDVSSCWSAHRSMRFSRIR